VIAAKNKPDKSARFANKTPEKCTFAPSENAEKGACIKFPNRYDLRLLAPS